METRKAEDLHESIVTARDIMIRELDTRFFEQAERPSNTRCVQLWMSKQYPAEKWIPEKWRTLAKALYLKMLRDAAKIAGIGIRSSPPRKVQKANSGAGCSSLVRNLSDDEEATPAEAADFDTVTDEAARWAALEKHVIREYRDDAGIVNEFALMYHLRNSFPLHYIAFKQTASHIPHEGNSEQLFSRSGALSDDNGKMDPARLAVWTSIGVNYSIYTSRRPSRSSSGTCSSSARVARPLRTSCMSMTLACSILSMKMERATWCRLAATSRSDRERSAEGRRESACILNSIHEWRVRAGHSSHELNSLWVPLFRSE